MPEGVTTLKTLQLINATDSTDNDAQEILWCLSLEISVTIPWNFFSGMHIKLRSEQGCLLSHFWELTHLHNFATRPLPLTACWPPGTTLGANAKHSDKKGLGSALRASQLMEWDGHLKLEYNLVSPILGIYTGIWVYSREPHIINLVWIWKELYRECTFDLGLEKILEFIKMKGKKIRQVYTMARAKAWSRENTGNGLWTIHCLLKTAKNFFAFDFLSFCLWPFCSPKIHTALQPNRKNI